VNKPDVLPGDRIRLVQMGPDPCPIPPGATGTVRRVVNLGWIQICVQWDIHRSLALVWPEDQFHVIERPRAAYFREALE
jgi:hypothetical protein